MLYSIFFVAVGLLYLSCTSNKKQSDENLTLEPVADVEIVGDTVKSPSVEILVDVSESGHVEKIYDTVINGVKFRDFYFKCEGEGEVISDETDYCLPIEGNAEALEKIWKSLVGLPYDKDALQKKLEKECEAIMTEPKLVKEDMDYDEEMQGLLNHYVYPVFVDGGLVSYAILEEWFYESMLHPQSMFSTAIYSLETGEKILQDDILDDSQSSRQAVVNEIYRRLVEYADGDESYIMESCRGDDKMSLLNDNLGFDENSLIYNYERYEVFPYMMGTPSIGLPKEWIKPYLKKDGILYEYWFKN